MQESTKKTNRLFFALYLGFFAGVIWGGLHLFLETIRFTRISLNGLIRPFLPQSEFSPLLEGIFGWVGFIVLSIAASLLYVALFAKVRGPWLGIVYGLMWGTLTILSAGSQTGGRLVPKGLDWNSLSTEMSVFMLWGLFIGYSTAFEFTDERQREPVAK